jgi:EAL domain-containing protein (putative c-di-GMP-specific phosphodiesterase class I)/GGDEF domain-containing protein
MSLIHQIRIALFLVIIATASGSLIFSTLGSKAYLEEELIKKNLDNANVLALAMSQMDKDPITIDLFISAQFDAGHYRYIGLFDPNGAPITERVNHSSKTVAPDWFARLFKITVNPGFANIQTGWTQYGTINVESDANFAYDKLWTTMKNMLIWVLSIGLLTYIVCGFLLTKILEPLADVIGQARAIAERRFITIKEPKTKDFKLLVREMNSLSNRIKDTVQLESERLNNLSLKINYDEITGLMNHDFFLNTLESQLQDEQFSGGALIIVRINNLASIDQSLGYVKTNLLLKTLSQSIQECGINYHSTTAGRLNGRDLAIFINQAIDEFSFAHAIKDAITQIQTNPPLEQLQPQYLIVSAKAKHIDEAGNLLKVLDFILELSSLSADQQPRVINANSIVASKTDYLSEWKTQLSKAIQHKWIKLELFPVLNTQQALIHFESPVRLRLEEEGKWLTAGEFINWASELDLISTIDLLALEVAIQTINDQQQPICLNISEQSMLSTRYIDTAIALIKSKVHQPGLLSFEVPEVAVFNHIQAFKQFCMTLKDAGCHVGIEHVCLRISRLGELYDLGLDYIKFDASLIRGLHQNETNQALLRGLCMVARSIGILAIAEGVNSKEEIIAVKDIGMDGLTGPAVKQQD